MELTAARAYPESGNEAGRLAALRSYDVLGTAPDQALEDLALLAARVIDAPAAAIAFVGDDRVWLTARVGLGASEIPREDAFCDWTISHGGTFVVEDAAADARFATSPLATEEAVRFYAGAPLLTVDGHALGAICALDRRPRTLGPGQAEALAALARQVVTHLELRRRMTELEQASTHVRLLQEVAVAANEASKIENALAAALERICSTTGSPLGHVYLRDGEELRPSAIWHDASPGSFASFRAATDKTRQTEGSGLAGLVLADGRPHWLTRTTAEKRGYPRTDGAAEDGIHSGFAFPVIVDGEVSAVLEFFSPELLEPDQPLLDVLAGIGRQLGRVIERKNAETDLRAAETRYRVLVEQLPLALYAYGLDEGHYPIYRSPQIVRMLGYSIEEWRADPDLFPKLLHSEDRERVMEQVARVEQTGDRFCDEFRIIAKDGRTLWVHDENVAVFDTDGRPLYRQGFMHDVSERRRAEEVLRDSEERVRLLFDAALDAVVTIDATGTITGWNAQAETTFGWKRDEAIGRLLVDTIVPEQHRLAHLQGLERYLETREPRVLGRRIEITAVNREGRELPVELAIVPIERQGKIEFSAFIRDVAESKHREELLRLAERRYRTLVEQLPLTVYIDALDDESSAIYMSPQIEALLGYTVDEWLSERNLFVELLHPDDRERVLAEVARTNRSGEAFRAEYRLVARDGREIWIEDEAVIVADEVGNRLYSQGYLLDITARKRAEAELARQNDELRALDELKDEFVALVSHELRTPLTSIRGYLELVLEGEGGQLTDAQERFLRVVDRNAERLQRLVGDLLFIAQLDAGRLSLSLGEVDLAEIAAESVEAARPAAGEKGVELVLDLGTPAPLSADGARLGQLLDNLVSNAVKFTPAGGRVDVRIAARAGGAELVVADTGIGIRADEQERLFERFFRSRGATEAAIQGTGLGLAISKAIVEAHGGDIAVTSVEGHGTTFTIHLPQKEES